MKTEELELNVPDEVDKTVATVFGNLIAFTRIEHDQDCESPTENDGFGTFWSGSRKHINFKSLSELAEMAEQDPDAVKLSYYEHGNSLWYVPGHYSGIIPDKQWDNVDFAGLWVPDEYVRESYAEQDGLSRRDWMEQQAKIACEEYTSWCNGECYGYIINVYRLEHDEDGEPLTEDEDDYSDPAPLSEDSCWGHIGWDWAVRATRDALEYQVKHAKETHGNDPSPAQIL